MGLRILPLNMAAQIFCSFRDMTLFRIFRILRFEKFHKT